MDHEIPVRIVDNQEYMKVVHSILEEGKEVPLVVTGNSMMPFLIDRRDQVLIKRIERPLKKGDIAFFQRENGQYILHRIHFMRKDKKNWRKPVLFYWRRSADNRRTNPGKPDFWLDYRGFAQRKTSR